ncbi:phosphatidylinositol 3-kinase VPS34 NDAI_0G02160 [Naumovozyma dairenensis CBS 421]|uniref:Phosphatidylinositol 3-kinase VPS34 n=1 Tax=Naumovozyma dairenensis (strain ATCC 10597 / BCRC 20456 / CBS 421 / NBRC 0211 / NRRL Y-12639) TaxID=1071378 RepID=G0WDY0_NAUDC|nr:hypothetical protein NDAI_0G02160 [Naumovozyma dairenensis CBS 421]CCD25991.2 hypothetical protein NDAI_0G02160 [Naumovozyma dairenensis CBS 421]
MPANNTTFCISQDLEIPLRIKIGSLQGQKPLLKASQRFLNPTLTQKGSNMFPNSDFIVSIQVIDQERDRNLTIPIFTPYIPFKHARKWDHWLTLPIQIKQLHVSNKLKITIWEYDGFKRIPFFQLETYIYDSNDFQLKRGKESLMFKYVNKDDDYDLDEVHIIENDPIQCNLNKYYQGEIKKVDWLDKITIPKLESLQESKKLPLGTFVLNIEFPIFEMPVIFVEKSLNDTQNQIPTLHNFELTNNMLPLNNTASIVRNNNNNISNGGIDSNHNKTDARLKISLGDKYNSTLKIYDPDQFSLDPIEEKFRRLERAAKHSNLDRQVKPNAKKRDYLNKIINYPPGTKLTAHEKGSIWKYRYYLMNNKKALTKLLQSTNLAEESERGEVLELMDSWAEIDIDDAIELLGSKFKNLSVRSYAVNRLKKAADSELELYLLQLVQAVCFENVTIFTDKTNSEFTIVDMNATGSLDATTNSIKNIHPNQRTMQQQQHNIKKSLMKPIKENGTSLEETPIVISPLAEFLIRRALKNRRLGNFFYWYLKAESQDNPYLNQILDSYWGRLSKEHKKILKDEILFDNCLHSICEEIKNLRDTITKKVELLNHLLITKLRHILKSKTIYLPLDPNIQIIDVIPESSKVFKSSLSPLKITFKTADNSIYALMYKVGDDLRQDQLVVQIISLMNELLKNENVDLKLTPYKILATGPQEGAIQFIPNDTMADILSKYHGILPFLKGHYPDSSQESGVQDWVMDNFVKSCAGYCVITYILGVGDRHLDNLLITPEGYFFHADFGYILGQDPKPFPPLMKLPPQIVEAFGGAESSNYNKFRSYCFVAYSILRRNAGLILNLFELMKMSNIPDIRIDPNGAILKVQERFNLDMSEEDATIHFQTLINGSLNALLPIVIDHLHNLAQYWRA